jgi:hypothetical protein
MRVGATDITMSSERCACGDHLRRDKSVRTLIFATIYINTEHKRPLSVVEREFRREKVRRGEDYSDSRTKAAVRRAAWWGWYDSWGADMTVHAACRGDFDLRSLEMIR